MAGDWPEGVGRFVLDETDSTNAEAARRAGSLDGPAWILARRQTAGRGRRGRAWISPAGNFAATYVCPNPAEPPQALAQRSFVMSLAVRDAFEAATGRGADFTLKWPNDVLARGAKIAGILLESAGAASPDFLAVGVGVNLAAAPDPASLEPGAVAPTSLRAVAGVRIAPEAFLDLLAPAFDRRERAFRDHGFAATRAAWLAHAARRGETVTARMPGREVAGVFDTVDDEGALVLKTPQGPVRVSAADIQF